MRSVLGYLSPYVRSLELHVESLESERSQLLDRVLLLTTGQPLAYKPVEETPLTSEQKKAVRDKIDEISDVNNYPTMAELLADAEAHSFHVDAEDLTGREEIVEGADVINSHRESAEEEHRAVLARRKKMQHAVVAAVTEYKENTKPVELE